MGERASMALFVSIVAVAVWAYLLLGRGRFWHAVVEPDPGPPAAWPPVVAVVPARNEALCLETSLNSLLDQRYAGDFSIIVVDDDSDDRTPEIATAAALRNVRPVTVVSSAGPPPDWTGKLWALRQGLARAPDGAKYVLFTDADIMHAPDSVSMLVARAERGGLVLTSLMARLRCESLAERLHIPAFIYFFQMLFPFAWACRPAARTAAAAGGCMLVSRAALQAAGGLESIRNALIDDCALAARMKAVGPIWLGLTDRVVSIRAYPGIADIRQMISRSAYAQLRHSPWLLFGTIAGMALTFLAPPLLLIFADGAARVLGGAAWLAMAASFVPILRFYRMSLLWAPALPLIALLYAFYTLDSAYRHVRGVGGAWKGRTHVPLARKP
jgi:hopene-associated glycosyltransferase HpnB